MVNRLVVAALAGLALAACATETRTVVVAEDSCVAYGFRVNTPEYRQCQAREMEARRTGRMQAGYGEGRIVADAQAACRSYGLTPYTDRYDRCVRHEYSLRQPV